MNNDIETIRCPHCGGTQYRLRIDYRKPTPLFRPGLAGLPQVLIVIILVAFIVAAVLSILLSQKPH